jgi:hypothetical protein
MNGKVAMARTQSLHHVPLQSVVEVVADITPHPIRIMQEEQVVPAVALHLI